MAFKENLKWGIKENDQSIIAAVYDTVFNFDKSNSLCLVCFKTKSSSSNKFIKVNTTTYNCNYLNKKSERFILKNKKGDTCSVFQLGKNTVKQYTEPEPVFKVSHKNLKYLVAKNFKQISFGDYYDIDPCDDPNYFVTQKLNEAEVAMTGLINLNEEVIIPYDYSGIKMNPSDSLIMVCGAGVRNYSEDYVFDYAGKKTQSYRHHIDLATKEHIIFKVFEPKEHYLVHNIASKEEKELIGEEVKYYQHENILVRIKNIWYIYNLNNNEKTEFKK